MDASEWLTGRFEEHRPRLRAVAYRMLGSLPEADDAVQEAWLKMWRADPAAVENIGGWLTTVVARVCLDQLRSRTSRREEPLEERDPDPIATDGFGSDPEQEAVVADSVGLALLVVLETLTPAERVAFVLHDLFAVPFEEIAPIVGRSPQAARQLASRGRRRIRGVSTVADADPARQREVVEAFLAASRGGDFDALVALLDPEVVLRADGASVAMGADREVRGAAIVAETFSGRARAARPALLGGSVGLVWAPGGKPTVAFAFAIAGGRVTRIEMVADPERLRQLDVVVL